MSHQIRKRKEKMPLSDAQLVELKNRHAETREKYNVPFWNEPEAYNYSSPKTPRPLTPDQLRWEFLRRDPTYRFAWENGTLQANDFGLYEVIAPNIRADKLETRRPLFLDVLHRGGRLTAPASVFKDLDNMMPEREMRS